MHNKIYPLHAQFQSRTVSSSSIAKWPTPYLYAKNLDNSKQAAPALCVSSSDLTDYS